MGRTQEIKACANTFCDRTLSGISKHQLCQRCRAYDKRSSTRTPHWARHRHSTLCRWDVLLMAAAPKDTFKGLQPLAAVTVAAKPLREIVTPIPARRSRARAAAPARKRA
jgi:hypothetical protein